MSKTVYGSPDVTTKYCYDGDQVIAEYDGSDNLLRKFIYGPGIDEPICMVDVADSNTVYYYSFDGLGSVVALSDVNNVIVESYSYDVFGAPTIYDANYTEISPSAIGNPYMFTARRADDETALYYYRARYYAFDIGRFLQTDPIGYDDGLNLYAYVGNNPVNMIDPMGLCKGERSFARKLWEGDYVGTQYGDYALDRYAYEIAFGNAKWYHYVGGAFSALWTPKSWKSTALTLAPSAGVGKWIGRPFYRYVGGSSSKSVTWMTRGWGWKPPYTLAQAAKKLHLVDDLGTYRVPSKVIKVKYKAFKMIAGPRLVKGFKGFTGALEYYWGKIRFPK